MQPIRIPIGAHLRLSADFARGPVLNLDFLDEGQEIIPFHLSLRRDEGLVVVNRRDAAGWRREIRVAMRFDAASVPVDIQLSATRVRVQVGGRRIGSFDAWPRPSREGRLFLRRGFPGLNRIVWLRPQGEIVAGSLHWETGEAPPEGLHLGAALDLRLVCAGPHAPGGARLQIDGMAETWPAVARLMSTLHSEERAVLSVTLPGRVWLNAGEALSLRLMDGAREVGSLRLTRADMADKIAALALAGSLAQDDTAALCALEHLRHGGMGADLSPEARRAVGRVAAHFGLLPWLAEGNLTIPVPPLTQGESDVSVAEATMQFFERVASPDADPLGVLRALSMPLMPIARQHDLFNGVTRWFCHHGDMRGFLRFGQEIRVPHGGTGGAGWAASLDLPRRYGQGDFDGVAAGLRGLVAPSVGWLETPAIGWTLREAARLAPDLAGRTPADWQRWAIVAAFVDLLEARRGDYWGRVPCTALREAMVAVVLSADTLPADLAERVRWSALHLYGLTPAFWDSLAQARAAGWQAPPRLSEAATVFADLRALVEDEALDPVERRIRLAPLLDHFRQIGTADHPRVRRDLLGPGGVVAAPADIPAAALRAGLDPDEALLRHAAHPLTEPLTVTPALSAGLRAGLRKAMSKVPSAPLGPAIAALRDEAARVLHGADPQRLCAALPPLGGATARFLGLSVAMDTARGVLRQGRAAQAEVLLRTVEAVLDTLQGDTARADLARECAPAMSLGALAAEWPDDPAVQRLHARLQGIVALIPQPQTDDRAADLRALADPVQDTLLCLYSCRANLDTRVRTIRETWAPLLTAMGVPMLVFVGDGDGDGTRQGDVVALDCPDTYEGLPQKTLAMLAWVHDHTRFSHLVKIDDDCVIDPAAWFGDLAHRGTDYYGRRLHRAAGQMDRAWHMVKSTTPRGRLELDKSPEPSTYADGGSGYALSRRAMAAALAAARSTEGQALVRVSFMEDKLLGDLLASRGIWVENTDYRVSILRRSRPGGPLLPQWENAFLPFKGSGLKLAHLDGLEGMAEAVAGFDAPLPVPSKVWPSYQSAALGWSSNALTLLSPRTSLERAAKVPVAVVACLRNERAILPRFLDHYRALGVEGFLIADNGSDDGSLEMLLDQPDVAVFSVDTDYSQSQFGVAWQQALMANFRCGLWSLVADADEFLFWNEDLRGDLREFVASAAFQGADAARVFMLDMVPPGPLAEADVTRAAPFKLATCVERAPFLRDPRSRGPFSDATVWTSALRHRLIAGSRPDLFVAQKIALLKYRPWMRLSAGLHFVAEARLAQRDLLFAHFKYTAAFHAKTQAEVARRQHYNDAEEYRAYQAVLAEGRDVLFDPAHSVPWRECAVVRHLLAGGRIEDQPR